MKALVISFSHIKYDNRVKSSINALSELGYKVHSITLDSLNSVTTPKKFPSLKIFTLQIRSFLYLLVGFSTSDFSRFYLSRPFVFGAQEILKKMTTEGASYNKIVIHDWEPIGLFKSWPSEKIYLDCHEYSLDEAHPYLLKPLMDKYKSWLIHRNLRPGMRMATVSSPIAHLYEKSLGSSFSVITNRHQIPSQKIERVDSERVKIAYSGKAGPRRKLFRLFIVSLLVGPRFEFDLFLAEESRFHMFLFKLISSLSSRFNVKEPLPRELLARELVQYDCGIFIADAKSSNTRLCRPNKVYEYISASLPIIATERLELAKDLIPFGFVYSLGEGLIVQHKTIRGLTKLELGNARARLIQNRQRALEVLERDSITYRQWLSNK